MRPPLLRPGAHLRRALREFGLGDARIAPGNVVRRRPPYLVRMTRSSSPWRGLGRRKAITPTNADGRRRKNTSVHSTTTREAGQWVHQERTPALWRTTDVGVSSPLTDVVIREGRGLSSSKMLSCPICYEDARSAVKRVSVVLSGCVRVTRVPPHHHLLLLFPSLITYYTNHLR